MALKLVTAPAVEPIALADAKTHLRVDATAEDTLITSLIVAARQHAENVTQRGLITQAWDLQLDAWPNGDEIRIPLPPLQSITSVKYYDTAGTEYTMTASDYIVDTKSEPGRIVLAYGKSWPSTTLRPAAGVLVRFVAGYGAAAANVPDAIIAALKLHIGHLHEHREAVNVGNIVNELPLAYDALLWPYRVLMFA